MWTYVGRREQLDAADWIALGWSRGEAEDFIEQDGATEARVYVRSEQGEAPLIHHVKHSPSGFEWGYEGSGPAELARCILWHLYGGEPAVDLYQDFKREVVAGLDPEGWELSGDDVAKWVTERRQLVS